MLVLKQETGYRVREFHGGTEDIASLATDPDAVGAMDCSVFLDIETGKLYEKNGGEWLEFGTGEAVVFETNSGGNDTEPASENTEEENNAEGGENDAQSE
jgi:hypothetical protein